MLLQPQGVGVTWKEYHSPIRQGTHLCVMYSMSASQFSLTLRMNHLGLFSVVIGHGNALG
jgi:hypothetical protein